MDASIVHHPYRNGYSVLPQLRKIDVAEIFQVKADQRRQLCELKQEAMRLQIWHVEADCPDDIKQAVRDWLFEHYPLPLVRVDELHQLTPQLAEDVVIHRFQDGRDWMAYGDVCFASGWRPEEKIGRPFAEIHQPVAGMDLSRSEKLVQTIIHGGPFERFVWSVIFEPRLNGHPRIPKRTFDPDHPVVFVKVERQITVGIPEHEAVLFLFKQSLIPEADIDKPALVRALNSMTLPQRRYKDMDGCFEELVAWLEKGDHSSSSA